ncbi:hypothetical protein B0A49_13477 [Cryomyces minteri]|uniref:Ribosomal RNA-processing protein 1 n=1 Tax=Cryomyces minteri TaxID=331657 RepID=A0A4U0VSS4_9PEZI|nr:hypothetical protein B0A49_13477 [Cryomyces minteri]
MASVTPSNPFIKQLAANDRPTRDKALESLRAYLTARQTPFSDVELLKLWKGLFYCMWMSDRPRTQQRLAIDMAGLVDGIGKENFLPWMDAFWKTMSREWMGIDVLRMDKFLFLTRQYLAASFRYLARKRWEDTELVDQYMDILAETPLNPPDAKVPNGLRFHVLDIYVDELDKIDADREGDPPLKTLLWPLQRLEENSPVKLVRTRTTEALNDERLKDWNGKRGDASSKTHKEEDTEGDDEWGGFED